MGQNSTLTYIDEAGNAQMTKIQFSPDLDKTLVRAIATSKDRVTTARTIFATVTNSCDYATTIEFGSEQSSDEIPVGRTGVVIHTQSERGTDAREPFAVLGNTPASIDDHIRFADHYIEPDSVGAIYDARDKDNVVFFWCDWDGELWGQTVALTDLTTGVRYPDVKDGNAVRWTDSYDDDIVF